MAYARIHVDQLACCLDRSRALVVAPAPEPNIAVDHPEPVRPGIARRRGTAGVEGRRFEAARAIIEVFPSRFRFVHMRVDVYTKHFASFVELMTRRSSSILDSSEKKFTSTVVYCTTRSLSSNEAKVVRQ